MRPDGIIHADMSVYSFQFYSCRGCQYILICVCEGYNHFELIKSRTADAYIVACGAMIFLFERMCHHLAIARLSTKRSANSNSFSLRRASTLNMSRPALIELIRLKAASARCATTFYQHAIFCTCIVSHEHLGRDRKLKLRSTLCMELQYGTCLVQENRFEPEMDGLQACAACFIFKIYKGFVKWFCVVSTIRLPVGTWKL